jgi:acyl-CoA thioester hydrolase
MGLPSEPKFPVRIQLSILWGEMDALGHVNNLAYLRWFEEARIRYFARSGLLAEGGKIGVILAHQRCDYLAPLTYPDDVEIRVSTTKIGRSSFTLSFAIRSVAQAADVARGEGVLVAFDYVTGRSTAITDALRAGIEALESS